MTVESGVLVVGSITADVTAFSHRFPQRGETVLGDDVTLVLGGKGANQAVASARAKTPTYLVGCIGNDLFATLVKEGLEADHVDLRNVQSINGRTGVAHIRVDVSGENDIVIVPLANSQVETEHVESALAHLAGIASVLLTQCEIRSEVTAYAIKAGHRAGLTVVLDPAPAVAFEESIWQYVDFVVPNESEASFYTGLEVTDFDSAVEAGRWFCQRGAGHALITLGSGGAVIVSASSVNYYSAFVVAAVDTTAAGDAFAGYFGSGLARGKRVDEAVKFAMAAGALAVTQRGASPSIPDGIQVDQFLTNRLGSEHRKESHEE